LGTALWEESCRKLAAQRRLDWRRPAPRESSRREEGGEYKTHGCCLPAAAGARTTAPTFDGRLARVISQASLRCDRKGTAAWSRGGTDEGEQRAGSSHLVRAAGNARLTRRPETCDGCAEVGIEISYDTRGQPKSSHALGRSECSSLGGASSRVKKS